MKHKLLSHEESGRSYVVVFDPSDDVLAELQRFCENEGVYSARLSGIGGLQRATLGFYNVRELLSLLGNVANYQGKPRIHSHCVAGHRDGHTSGGHLLAGIAQLAV